MLGHSSVAVAHEGRTLVIDPGILSDHGPLAAAEAVLVSHGHPDHLEAEALAGIDAEVWAPEDVAPMLRDSGIDQARIHVVGPGAAFRAAGIDVRVFGGEHAEVHPELPRARNNAHLIAGRILHTGDALPEVEAPEEVRALLLPIAAPWLRLADAIAYARGFGSAVAHPMHDGVLSEAGQHIFDGVLNATLGPQRYRRLAPGVPEPVS
ncbi:MBL fold metallo-hydrolase [Leucobacter triazinivorans]|uniref:MBL fold metallo-hydrolase n=1 Tax=Leucobacter triazinivorans TaxID=1784719 RepID=A0A4P6KDM6_9MICO|nr:MBL fold metallo-hydrolase [Leucobacter triazinivorans]QBE48170.1 MBL fold metallo-hydrolase [Leucobacter triazinivorans]